MSIATEVSNLVITNLNSESPSVYWKGQLVQGVVGIRADSEGRDWSIKLRVNGAEDSLYAEMASTGILIKRVH